MIDATHHVSSVRREVGDRVLEAGQARVLTISQSYDAPLEDMWDACTNPERIPRWFLPVSGDLREGGRYKLEGNAEGTIERCDPPRMFAATWEFGGEVSWIEVRLAEEGAERTRLTLEHVAHVDDTRWLQYGPGAVGVGWDMALVGLAAHAASGGAPVDQAEAQAWLESDAGRDFVARCSGAWAEASIAAGTPEADARAAAARTTAFYTGAEEPPA